MVVAEEIRPNFFILGAPKCGTTALAEYLASHPDILFSAPKEAKFFHTDFAPEHRLVHSLADYLSLFGKEHARRSFTAVGEGTVWYLFSKAAVPNILEFNPRARFVVMVRNPIELAHSLHSQLLYGGEEDVEDFEEAWRLQDKRASGQNLPRFVRDPKSLQYGSIAKVGEQLKRLYGQVPRERVLAIVFDDFRARTEEVYQRAVGFLGVADDHRKVFPVVNPNRQVRLKSVARTLWWASAIKRSMGLRRSLGVWRALSPFVSRRAPRRELSESFHAELAGYFRADVELLARLLDRDLEHWLL